MLIQTTFNLCIQNTLAITGHLKDKYENAKEVDYCEILNETACELICVAVGNPEGKAIENEIERKGGKYKTKLARNYGPRIIRNNILEKSNAIGRVFSAATTSACAIQSLNPNPYF